MRRKADFCGDRTNFICVFKNAEKKCFVLSRKCDFVKWKDEKSPAYKWVDANTDEDISDDVFGTFVSFHPIAGYSDMVTAEGLILNIKYARERVQHMNEENRERNILLQALQHLDVECTGNCGSSNLPPLSAEVVSRAVVAVQRIQSKFGAWFSTHKHFPKYCKEGIPAVEEVVVKSLNAEPGFDYGFGKLNPDSTADEWLNTFKSNWYWTPRQVSPSVNYLLGRLSATSVSVEANNDAKYKSVVVNWGTKMGKNLIDSPIAILNELTWLVSWYDVEGSDKPIARITSNASEVLERVEAAMPDFIKRMTLDKGVERAF
jgi:hypothetical protein